MRWKGEEDGGWEGEREEEREEEEREGGRGYEMRVRGRTGDWERLTQSINQSIYQSKD